ncbi:MAG: hypothetical protein EDM75_04300 [Chlorobiota bacterium]|nr:MAG: hypothetical protein EDM75_04300 [Chlorobiota bacterium]
MRRLFFLQFLLFLMLPKVINGQTDPLAMQMAFADSLFSAGKFYDAFIEAERLAFFDTLRAGLYWSTFLRGKCLKETGQFKDARKFFETASLSTSDRNRKFEAEVEILKVLILERRFRQFDDRSAKLEKVFPEKGKEFAYWKGWRHIFAGEWDDAKESLSRAGNSDDLIALCDSAEDKSYSMTLGMVMSAILPGAGQVYAGEYINPVITMAWVAFGSWLVVDAIKAHRYFDAFIEANYIMLRFYRGNLSYTYDLITSKNTEIKNGILRFLQNNYKGPKP